MIPVCNSTFYTTTADTVSFYVTDGTNEIFRGKAYKAPDAAQIAIELNEIAKYHLHSDFTGIWGNTSGSFTMSDAAKTFSIYRTDNTLWGSTRFYNDWSYESSASTLSMPANNKIGTNMYKFTTTVNGSEQIVTSYSKPTANACGDYALYYINLKSGCDSFLIEGKSVESKTMEQFNYRTHNPNNNNQHNRENHRFQTNVKLNWELNTGWLSDYEAKILYDNLFTSSSIYLHNLKTNKIYPVHITDTSVTRKEFLNERSLISYKINVEYDNLRLVR